MRSRRCVRIVYRHHRFSTACRKPERRQLAVRTAVRASPHCVSFTPGPDESPAPPPAAAREIAQRLVERLPDIGPWIAATLEPAVRYVATAALDAEVPSGASKYGGAPDLPEDVAWPSWTDRAGDRRTQWFYAQIDLSEATSFAPASIDLPQDGLLSFFVYLDEELNGVLGLYSWEAPGSTVLYSPAGTALRRADPPVPMLPAGRFSPIGCWTWHERGMDMTDDEFDSLEEFNNEYNKELIGLDVSGYVHGGRHQLGGHERFIQHPVAE